MKIITSFKIKRTLQSKDRKWAISDKQIYLDGAGGVGEGDVGVGWELGPEGVTGVGSSGSSPPQEDNPKVSIDAAANNTITEKGNFIVNERFGCF